jgi:hypothetical protein
MFVAAAHLTRNGIAINYDGAYNNDDWNAVGDIFPPLVHWTVENVVFVEHESYLCDPTHPLCPCSNLAGDRRALAGARRMIQEKPGAADM